MSDIVNVTDATFAEDVLNSDKAVIVDFWAPWCGPCRRIAPILEEVGDELGDKVHIAKLNTDDNPQTPGRYGVMSIPTLLVFKGGNEVGRLVGVQPKAQLMDKIQAVL